MIYIEGGSKSRARECAPRRRRKVVGADVRVPHDVTLVPLDLNDVRVRVRTWILVERRPGATKCCDYHLYVQLETHVKTSIVTCADTAANLAMHQHPSPPAPRLIKQVSWKLSRLPRALATEHGTTTRLSKYATTHPLPRREQYL